MRDLFTCFVERGQTVSVDQAVDHYAMPLFKHQTEIICDLFATDNGAALFTSHADMKRVSYTNRDHNQGHNTDQDQGHIPGLLVIYLLELLNALGSSVMIY